MITLAFLLLSSTQPATDVVPLARAHAHNDYQHPHPLFDALNHGFCSVEADIFLTDPKTLLVGHTKADLKPERTLENLYLRPLRERIQQQAGTVYRTTGNTKPPPFYLLIDIKTEAATTYTVLHETLSRYADILTEVRDGKVIQRAVNVILSGSRPSLATLAKQSPRYAGYDGRLSDLDSDVPAHLMPMISDNWTLKILWNGEGTMPAKEREKLERIVVQAHTRQRLVRFWATPEKPAIWQFLYDNNVDFINTDRLADLKNYLLQRIK